MRDTECSQNFRQRTTGDLCVFNLLRSEAADVRSERYFVQVTSVTISLGHFGRCFNMLNFVRLLLLISSRTKSARDLGGRYMVLCGVRILGIVVVWLARMAGQNGERAGRTSANRKSAIVEGQRALSVFIGLRWVIENNVYSR